MPVFEPGRCLSLVGQSGSLNCGEMVKEILRLGVKVGRCEVYFNILFFRCVLGAQTI